MDLLVQLTGSPPSAGQQRDQSRFQPQGHSHISMVERSAGDSDRAPIAGPCSLLLPHTVAQGATLPNKIKYKIGERKQKKKKEFFFSKFLMCFIAKSSQNI